MTDELKREAAVVHVLAPAGINAAELASQLSAAIFSYPHNYPCPVQVLWVSAPDSPVGLKRDVTAVRDALKVFRAWAFSCDNQDAIFQCGMGASALSRIEVALEAIR